MEGECIEKVLKWGKEGRVENGNWLIGVLGRRGENGEWRVVIGRMVFGEGF